MSTASPRSPLLRSGTTQAGRTLAELDPAYFRIDERELADLVLYAAALAREVRYYGPDNQVSGDWAPFFDTDVTATLAAIARLPVEPFRTALADAEEFLKDEPGRAENELRAYFNLVFHLPVALFAELAHALERLSRDHPLHATLSQLIADDLAGPLNGLVRFYKGAIGAGLPLGDPEPALDPTDYGTGTLGDARPRLSETIARAVLIPEVLTQRPIAGAAMESLGAGDWAAFAATIAGDATPYQQAVGPNLLYEQVYDALGYNLLATELERVFQALERARSAAGDALARSLEEIGDHAPHYGLFLAFLDMLEVARDDLNELTGRHLDFYYREVLRLAPRAPVPASAHVLVELAKNVDARLVPAGTGLRAGKDAGGAQVRFELTDDLVVNRGAVAERRAVRVHSTVSGGDLHQVVYASPAADSADGLGEALADETRGWRPFGPEPWPEGATEARAPVGRVGFAVADRRLFLREGDRDILVVFELDAPLATLVLPAMRVRLTTPDGWHEVPGLMLGPFFAPTLAVAWCPLDGDQPPVVPFDPAVHADDDGAGYIAGLPVAELRFDFQGTTDATARAFALLRDVRIQKSYLYTAARGLRSLTFLAPDGAADPAKPFAAFGARPKTSAPLIVGSAEVFSKPLASLRFDVTWDETYSNGAWFRAVDPGAYFCSVSYLDRGSWQSAPPTDVLALHLDSQTPTLYAPGVDLAPGTGAMTMQDPTYDIGARNGFMRLELSTDFGHAAYVGELTRATIAIANSNNSLTESSGVHYTDDADGYAVPNTPYTPTVREIAVDYDTTLDAPTHFFHVAPFGQAERPAAAGPLLPPLDYEAALFVGVEGFESPARLALLAQVANGSGDPLLEVPQLAFDVLAGDDWVTLAEQDVDDKTDSLAASAIVGFALPDTADTEHGLMPGGLHWLRVSAASNSAAVNSLIALEAQGARTAFVDQDNDPQFLAEPLAAGTIAKLAVPDPRVKKVSQPFASFGGRAEEDDEVFRQRAAERLRHKDRASTAWDYERIALEAAPDLYRVKCLNHTELVRSAGKIVADNELSPGAVVVVTVPWTTGRPHLDPLRPYTDQATLKRVRDALSARVSPFVRLEIANPKFEEVQVSCKVAFAEGIDDVGFYLGELEKAVIGHLAPWSVSGGADITFGGKLRKSSVIDFVEELPYVDFLEDFEMYHRPDPDVPAWTPADMETIEATTARSILVSAPRHVIEELS